MFILGSDVSHTDGPCIEGTLIQDHSSADPEGGTGSGPPPWKITSYMGFYRELAIGPPWKKMDPPLENVGPPLEP